MSKDIFDMSVVCCLLFYNIARGLLSGNTKKNIGSHVRLARPRGMLIVVQDEKRI